MQIGSDMRGLQLYSPDLVMRARPTQEDGGANAASKSQVGMSAQERQVLAREQALKSRAPNGSTHTTYTYSVGPDGKRYIVGAEVSIIAPEEELLAATGGTGRPAGTKIKAEPAESTADEPVESDPETAAQIAKLQQTEREVVAHEAAHMAVGGQFAGSVSYTYTTGPDGKRYIVGGEVPISTPATSDPHEALRNAEQVMRAAMAPASPSGPDAAVAASAAQTAAAARMQIATQGTEGTDERGLESADSYAGMQAKHAYESTKSPKGLWTSTGGYEPHTEGAEPGPFGGPREREEIAA